MITKLTKDDIGKDVVLIRGYNQLLPGSTGIICSISSDGLSCTIKNVVGTIAQYCDDCDEYDCGCLDPLPYETSVWTLHVTFIKFNSFSTKNIILLLI